jgi:long-chain acyl-CoA synthetase
VTSPFSLLSFSTAAGGGRFDDVEAQELVAAGLTLLQRAPALVRALHRHRVGILLPTTPSFLTALAAAEGRGAVLINPLAAPPEVAFQIADAGIGAVLTIEALATKVPDGVMRVLLDGAPRRAQLIADGRTTEIDLGSHLGLPIEGELDVPGRDEEAVIVYTSAMGGVPRGAILTHRNLLANARATVTAAQLSRDDRTLALLPFSHLFGLVVSGLAPALAGGQVVCMDRFNPARALDLIETAGISFIVGVPSVFIGLAALLERRPAGERRAAMRTLRVCICGGAPLDPALQDRWHELTGVELRQGYGLTEAGPVCLCNRVDAENRRGTLGRPFPGVDVTIRDPSTGAALPPGAEGEICVSGDNISPGYIGGTTPSDDPWAHGLPRRGGWLRTGDLGVADADGAVRFRGVLKPMFTRNGFNIYPAEIERAVRELAGVRAATVRAIPDAVRENDIALEVEGDIGEADVRAWCKARLSIYKQPSEITIANDQRRAES